MSGRPAEGPGSHPPLARCRARRGRFSGEHCSEAKTKRPRETSPSRYNPLHFWTAFHASKFCRSSYIKFFGIVFSKPCWYPHKWAQNAAAVRTASPRSQGNPAPPQPWKSQSTFWIFPPGTEQQGLQNLSGGSGEGHQPLGCSSKTSDAESESSHSAGPRAAAEGIFVPCNTRELYPGPSSELRPLTPRQASKPFQVLGQIKSHRPARAAPDGPKPTFEQTVGQNPRCKQLPSARFQNAFHQM